jgi:AcrR family transcriptional regulator
MTRSESRERLLDTAERLFTEHGYAAVKLKQIASALGIAHASLYHHAPGGKEQLFIEVMERHFKRHQQGITAVVQSRAGDLRAQLHVIAEWTLSQPPLNLQRMVHSDLLAINPMEADRLSTLALESLIEPFLMVLEQAQVRGEIDHDNLGLVAGGLFGMIQSMHLLPNEAVTGSRHAMANQLIDTFLTGLYKR